MTETPDPIFEQASKQPDAAAIIHGRETITYHDLHFMVERAAARIREEGIAAGDRVAVAVEPSIPCIITLFALLRLGTTVCTLNPKQPSLLLTDQIRRLQPKLLLSDGNRATPSFVRSLLFTDLQVGSEYGHRRLIADPWSLDRYATVLFTSGSTDKPKAASHTWGNHYYSAVGSATNIPFGAGDRWLLSLPLFHVGGLAILFRAVVGGGCVVIPAHRGEIVETVIAHAVTHVSLVATQLYWLFSDPKTLADCGRTLKAVLLGGGPIPEGLVREACEVGLPVFTSYGMTEMSSQIATTPPGALPGCNGSSGKVLPYRELRIDEDSRIHVRGNTLFAGYFEDGVVRRPVDDDGWFVTGDLGRVDDQGFLWVSGREDNLIISGGENIQAEEIEAALRQLPGIQDALVVGVPDEEFGERPVAFIQLDGTRSCEKHENFPDLLEEMLPKFKIPELIFHTSYPKPGQSLKTDRRQLTALARRMFRKRHD